MSTIVLLPQKYTFSGFIFYMTVAVRKMQWMAPRFSVILLYFYRVTAFCKVTELEALYSKCYRRSVQAPEARNFGDRLKDPSHVLELRYLVGCRAWGTSFVFCFLNCQKMILRPHYKKHNRT